MTKRELTLGGCALLVGLATGALLFWRRAPKDPPRVSVTVDATAPVEEVTPAPVASALPDDSVPILPPSPSDTSAPHDPPVRPKDAGVDASPIILRASNLLIHPASNERECVDAPTHAAQGLQLFPCHGRKNQRWTFAEDLSGANRIFGADGGCVRIAEAASGGEPPLIVGGCGTDSPRFRHLADKRLQEVQSGQCITVRSAEKRARLTLEACDPANGGQTWTFSP
jgi:hypothetical protein